MAGRPTPIQGVRVEPSQLVSSLVDPITRVWRIDSGLDQFREEERGEILDTPIGMAGKLDRLIWPADRRVRHTIKWGYQWIHIRNQRPLISGPSTSDPVDSGVWRCI